MTSVHETNNHNSPCKFVETETLLQLVSETGSSTFCSHRFRRKRWQNSNGNITLFSWPSVSSTFPLTYITGVIIHTDCIHLQISLSPFPPYSLSSRRQRVSHWRRLICYSGNAPWGPCQMILRRNKMFT